MSHPLLTGSAGFATVRDAGTILFDTAKITSDRQDIFFSNILHHSGTGSLFIELATRKRLRVNGTCRYENTLIEFSVKQSYPNCPKYIQRRSLFMPGDFETAVATTTTGKTLGKEAVSWIKKSDTFFVASAGADGSLDASHRGGNPGFIEVAGDGRLKIPDYPGNSLFNTLGNLVQDARAGLLFVDFENRQTLQLTGTASLLFDQTSDQDELKTKGTGRYWCLLLPAGSIRRTTTTGTGTSWNVRLSTPSDPVCRGPMSHSVQNALISGLQPDRRRSISREIK